MVHRELFSLQIGFIELTGIASYLRNAWTLSFIKGHHGFWIVSRELVEIRKIIQRPNAILTSTAATDNREQVSQVSETSPGGLVVAPVAKHGRTRPWSFPRKRESTPQTSGNALSTDWIPAFAGMTGVSKGMIFEITPLPAGLQICNTMVLYPAASGANRRGGTEPGAAEGLQVRCRLRW